MPELATAWVTLAVSADNMQRDIKRAFKGAESSTKLSPDVDTAGLSRKATSAGRRFGDLFGRSAKLSPDVDTSKIGAQGSRAGEEFGRRFSGTAKAALGALSAAAVGGVVVDQFRQVMSVGMDWTKNMNTLQSVSGATAEQMKAVGAAARALGTDVALPATSANDAAAAMTELAKGGFSVEQSMAAARGSLQLAAAAGVSATEAATLQSSALQAFGLDASSAGKMSDTLANAANASSAEITDVAYALQAAGTVANQFGLTAEDTSAAIALLANNGIKGSDAGTLLKTSLLALTDQGKPAQGAIQELGLKVYDAQGKFVGLHALMEQLGMAAGSMTAEQYQAATATLFGSDAMRFAGVAAKDGSKSYDLMRTAIDRQGAAADVAAAKTKGLPGAYERVKNAIESLQLKAYDVLEGPISKLLDGLSGGLDKFSDSWDKLAGGGGLSSVGDAVKGALPAFLKIGESLGKAAATIGVVAWKAFAAALETAANILKGLTPALNVLGNLLRDNQGLVTALVAGWVAFKTVPGILGSVSSAFLPLSTAIGNIGPKLAAMRTGVAGAAGSWGTMVGYLKQANPQMSTAQANMTLLKNGASGLASGGIGVVRGAMSGLVGALGGPLNIALMGATALFGVIASKNAEASAAMDGYRDAAKRAADAQVELNNALLKSNGLMDDAAKASAGSRVQSAIGELDAASKSSASWLDQFRDSSGSLAGGFASQIFDFGGANEQNNLGYAKDVRADTARAAKEAIDGLKLSQQALADQVQGGQPIFDALVASLEKQGSGGYVAAEKLKQARMAILGAQEAGAVAGPVLAKLGEDVEASAARIQIAFSALPTDVPINVSMDGGQPVYDMLVQLGEKVRVDNDKNIVVESPLAPDVLKMLAALGFSVRTDNDKLIIVRQDGAEVVSEQIDQAAKDRTATITVLTNTLAAAVDAGAALGVEGRADGALVAMAGGGLRTIRKPDSAGIYAGRGAGTIFAEQETGGEAYIPLAAAKRGRSVRILAEVARLFGLSVMESGGITVEALKAFASNISGQPYRWGAGNGDTFSTDCSGAQSAIANYITGGSGRFSTADAAGSLLGRGFRQGDPPEGISAYWIGWRNGGPGGGHTAGTIVDPLGGNVNVEMGGRSGGGQFGGAAAGASDFPNRAWIALAGGDDPANSNFGSSAAVQSASAGVSSSRAAVTSAKASLQAAEYKVAQLNAEGAAADKIAVAEKRRDAAQEKLTAAEERQAAAETRLSEVKDKAAQTTEKQTTQGGDGQAFGQSLVSGLLQGIGVDGSVFSNPLEWPNVKSGLAAVNWGGGLLQNILGQGARQDSAGYATGGPSMPGVGIPNVADFIKPIGPAAATQPMPDAPHPGGGAAPGPAVVVNGNIGMDPVGFTQRIDAHQNQAVRRNLAAVRPS